MKSDFEKLLIEYTQKLKISDFFDIFYSEVHKYKYKFKKRQMRKFVLIYSKDC